MQLILKRIFYVLVLAIHIMVGGEVFAQSAYESEDELKLNAARLFEEKKFEEAMPLYSQLLSNYPKDPEYNYKYGASLLMSGEDREKALKYLEFAISKGGIEEEAYYYLGKAYHLNYDFSNAIKFYNRFQNLAAASLIDEYEVDHQIEMCSNGKQLLKKVNGIEVLKKQEISKEDFYRVYDLEGIDGKILAKPKEFMMKYDEKINEKSIIFLPADAREVYFSSYGKDGKMGRDLFKVVKLGNGNWSEPLNLGENINTAFDENYVFAHPDGKTLYFSSTGHNSMGGYDLFKSIYDPTIAQWSIPENLDFAYSTVNNDLLFVTDKEHKIAYFSSDRNTSSDRLTVYKVNTDKVPVNLSVIKGKFIAEDMPIQKAKITVLSIENQTLGVFETDEEGNYEIAINENGGSYRFNIETTDDAPIHSGQVNIPEQSSFKIYAQELHLMGTGSEQRLLIKNIFDDPSTEQDISLSPEILKMQANLEVNATEESIAEANAAFDQTQEKVVGNKNVAKEETSAVKQGQTSVEKQDEKLSRANADGPMLKEDSAESLSAPKSKVQISEEFQDLKIVSKETHHQKSKQSEYAYFLSNAKSLQAKEHFLEAERLKKELDNASAEQVKSVESQIQELKEEGGKLAAQASFANQLARLLENETQESAANIQMLSAMDAELAENLSENNLVAASEKLESLKNASAESNEIEQSGTFIRKEILLEDKTLIDSEISVLTKEKLDLQKKESALELEINSLESEKKSASNKRSKEIDVLLSDLKAEKADIDFQIQQAESKLSALKKNRDELNAELHFLDQFENLKENLPENIPDNYEKEEVLGHIKYFRENNLFVYVDHNLPLTQNLPTEEELLTIQKNIRSMQLQTEEPTLVNNGTSENFSTNEVSEEVEVDARVTTSTSSEEDDFSNLKYENDFSYSIVEASSFKVEAEKLKNKARSLNKAYQQKIKEVENLPTVEARTAAFGEINKLKAESQAAQIAAANAYAKANRMEYLKNSAKLRSVVAEESDNAQVALLLADEADLYYSYAKTLREKVKPDDRFSKKEVDYQKAYEYEMKALKKQLEALQIAQEESAEGVTIDTEDVTDANVARKMADALVSGSKELYEKANQLESRASQLSEGSEKESLLNASKELTHQAQNKLMDANVLYLKEIELNESNLTDQNSKSEINLLSPLTGLKALETDSIPQVDEDSRKEIKAIPVYDDYYTTFTQKENLVKEAEIEYAKAVDMKSEADSLKFLESSLRLQAVEETDIVEKDRLIKEASVINQTAVKINSSLDSLNHIIKIKNYLIQQKDIQLKNTLNSLNEEDAQRVVLLASVEYVENVDSPGSDLNLVSENAGTEIKAEEAEKQIEEEIDPVKVVQEEIKEISPTDFTESSNELTEIPESIKSDVFVITSNKKPVYSNTNPIPIEPVMPKGLIYQVQIGAFRNPISQDLFTGFAPLMGEKTPSGITRYTAGFFKNFKSGDSAKVKIRQMGYKDAFVVAYLNGKRISISEATKISGETIVQSSLSNQDVSSNRGRLDKFGNEYANGDQNESQVADPTSELKLPREFYAADVESVRNAKEIGGLYYSVQIGVFSKPIKKGVFENYGSLLVDVLPGGLLRYHVGVFDNLSAANELKAKIVTGKIADAYVVAYYNGNRISLAEAKRLQNQK